MKLGHRRTWRRWLNELSPMSAISSNSLSVDRDAMAEALAIAAPQGPRGVRCLDECDCGLIL